MRALLLVVAVACSHDGPHVIHEDVGRACFYTHDEQWTSVNQTVAYAADTSTVVRAGGFPCASCYTDQQAWCGVQRNGNRLHVDTLTAWIPYEGQCTRELCGLAATCEVEPLERGTYEVVFGQRMATLVIPSTLDRAFCIDSY